MENEFNNFKATQSRRQCRSFVVCKSEDEFYRASISAIHDTKPNKPIKVWNFFKLFNLF